MTARPGEPMRFIRTHVDDPHADDDPCVVWPFGRSGGYGQVKFDGQPERPHRVLLELRDGPPPSEAHEAIHGSCHNQLCLVHVRWGTHAENMSDKDRDGAHSRGERSPNAKLTKNDVRVIRELLAAAHSKRSIAKRFGVSTTSVSHIATGKTWADPSEIGE